MDPTPLRILIVDDDDAIRLSLREHLEAMGGFCQEARNGLQALASLKTQQVDVLLTDLCMPHMDGLELLHTLSEDVSFGKPIIILMSGGLTEEVQQKAQQAGAHAIIDKPFSFLDIWAAIQVHHDHFPQAA